MENGRWVKPREYCDAMGVRETTMRLGKKDGSIKHRMISAKMYQLWLPDDREETPVSTSGKTQVEVGVIATTQDTEITELDKELADMDKEEAKVDRLTVIAEKKLRLKSDIGWDTYQDRLKEMREAEAKLVADRAQLNEDRADLSKRDSVLDDVERSLRGSQKAMGDWWKDAGAIAWDVLEMQQAIQHEATYNKSNELAYRSKGTGFGGDTPPEKTLLMGNALKDRWYEVFKVLVKISRLPEPDFRIDVHRSDVELLDAGDYDKPDEQEPDEDFDLEAVGRMIDAEVEQVESEMPDIKIHKSKK